MEIYKKWEAREITSYEAAVLCRFSRTTFYNRVRMIKDRKMYMAFQKGTQTAPHGGIMPPQAGISTAGNGNSGCAGRRLTVAGHGGIMNPLLLMYKTGQRWRAT
jgi:hypothetical protein